MKGGLNLFVYVQNDPINWIDPDGLEGRSPYGEISAPPSFPQNALDYLNTDLNNFVNPSLPGSRVDVFMKYESLALELGTGGGAAGVRCFAHGGKSWHVGLELVGKKNLIHLGNHAKYGVHLAIGYVKPYVAWLHVYAKNAWPFFRIFIPK